MLFRLPLVSQLTTLPFAGALKDQSHDPQIRHSVRVPVLVPVPAALALRSGARRSVCPPAAAQQTTNAPVHLPEVVVTATRIPTALDRSPVAATVVTRKEMAERQLNTVADVLRAQAGVDVNQTGQPGGNTSVFLRGANGSHTLVLIDGVRVNRPFDNTFNFADLLTDNVERIEILRGPQSTIYGSEALGGVINIVTKQGGGNRPARR